MKSEPPWRQRGMHVDADGMYGKLGRSARKHVVAGTDDGKIDHLVKYSFTILALDMHL